MRAKISFAALAVIRDTETNSISAFNILEGVTAVGLPFFMQNAAFFVLWEREQGEPARNPATFTMVNAGRTLATQQITIDFGDSVRHRTIVNLAGLVVPSAGPLSFRVDIEGGIYAEYVVDVSAPAAPVQVRAQ